MPRFAANLNYLWTDLPPLDRLTAAVQWGFRRVEILRPEEFERAALLRSLQANELELVLFNTSRGSVDDAGTLAIPGREDTFRKTIDDALDLAKLTGTRLLHVVGGTVLATADLALARATAVTNLRSVADLAAGAGVTLLLENINAVDRPGDPFPTPEAAAAVVHEVAHPAVGLQFDFFHTGRAGLDPIAEYRRYKDVAKHIQIADSPGRHEPGTGSLPVTAFLAELDATGYDGVVGLEYAPSADTGAALSWLARPLS